MPEEREDRLARALASKNPRTRALALSALRGLSRPFAEPWIVAALADPEPEVRLAALRLAAAHRGPQVQVSLLHVLERGLAGRSPVEVRALAAAFYTAAPRPIPHLAAVLCGSDTPPAAAVEVARFLAGTRSPAAHDAVRAGERAASRRVRAVCAQLASRLPPPRLPSDCLRPVYEEVPLPSGAMRSMAARAAQQRRCDSSVTTCVTPYPPGLDPEHEPPTQELTPPHLLRPPGRLDSRL